MIKVNKKNLKEHGYTEHKLNHFQKCIKDRMGKRYFINIEYYDLDLITIPKSARTGYTCKFQFQNLKLDMSRNDMCPNFEMDIKYQDLIEVEMYIKGLWMTSHSPYYERF